MYKLKSHEFRFNTFLSTKQLETSFNGGARPDMSLQAESSAEQGPIRLTFLAYRKPGLSEEEFHRYWTEEHAPLVKEWQARCGVLQYTQVHYFCSMVS